MIRLFEYVKTLHAIPKSPEDFDSFLDNSEDWEKEYKANYLFFYLMEEELPWLFSQIKSSIVGKIYILRNLFIRKPNEVHTLLDKDWSGPCAYDLLMHTTYQVLADKIEIDVIDNNFWCKRNGEAGKQAIHDYIKEGQESCADDKWLEEQREALLLLIDIYDFYKKKTVDIKYPIINYDLSRQHAKQIVDNIWSLEHIC
jgi:hypothetical protein